VRSTSPHFWCLVRTPPRNVRPALLRPECMACFSGSVDIGSWPLCLGPALPPNVARPVPVATAMTVRPVEFFLPCSADDVLATLKQRGFVVEPAKAESCDGCGHRSGERPRRAAISFNEADGQLQAINIVTTESAGAGEEQLAVELAGVRVGGGGVARRCRARGAGPCRLQPSSAPRGATVEELGRQKTPGKSEIRNCLGTETSAATCRSCR